MNASSLPGALASIAMLVDQGSLTALHAEQQEELRRSVEALALWPSGDPFLPRVRALVTTLHLSGGMQVPSKRITVPDPILNECYFLMAYLDVKPPGTSN